MSSTRINISANLLGQVWTAVLGVVFTPIYLRYIGIESYGIIGIFMSLQAFTGLLDFGISPTINREMARLSHAKENAQEMHDIRRTLQPFNYLSALIVLTILCIASPLLARYWVQPKGLSVGMITQAFLIISFISATQFMSGFNSGGLIGLQKQVLLNTINIIFGTIRSVGGWLALAFYSPTILTLLLWQLFIVVLQSITLNIAFKKSLSPAPREGSYRKELLQNVWHFAVGMTGTSILAMILMQTDKVILSKMLSLKSFGHYSLAFTISSLAIGTIVGSISNVMYPKLCSIVASGNEEKIKSYYHHACQTMAVCLIPLVLTMAFYSYPILFIWTGDEEIVQNAAPLLSLIVIGAGLNGLMIIPYQLQLAYSWTQLGFYLLLGALFTLVPLMIAGVYFYTAIGGIIAWIIYNGLYGSIMIWIMHRKILIGEQWRWFYTTIKPIIAALSFNILIHHFFYESLLSSSIIFQFTLICLIGAATMLICLFFLPSIRSTVKQLILNRIQVWGYTK